LATVASTELLGAFAQERIDVKELKSQATGKAREWRSIETAPKDGTHILSKVLREGYMNGNNQTPPVVVHWFEGSGIEPDGWYASNHGSQLVTPDVWMPLPPPPNAQ
jgi:hypothetical protein